MPRTSRAYLNNIIESILKIEHYTQGITLDDLIENEMLSDAVIRNLEIIGEAVNNISDAVRKRSKGIEWDLISGLRIILAHKYFGIDYEVIWNIITEELPNLKGSIQKLLDSPDN